MTNQVRQRGLAFLLIWYTLLMSAGRGSAKGDEDGEVKDGTKLFNVDRTSNHSTFYIFVGDSINDTFTITDFPKSGTFFVTLIQKDANDFKVVFNELRNVSSNSSQLDATMNVTVTGTQLISSDFDIVAIDEQDVRYKIFTQFIGVKRIPNKVAQIVRYLVTVAVVVTIWLIGVTTDVLLIKRIIKRPYGVVIGMVCQFVIMPFVAWSLAKIFQITGSAAVGLVLDGSCPGGTNSNLLSVLLDVDYVLSITMTFFSTIIALGMMPLNLFIYGSSFVEGDEKIRTPFLDIVIQLLFLVIPVSLGIIIGWRWPKVRHFADKYIKPVSAVIVVILICTDLPFNLFIFDSPWEYYCAAFIFPCVGALAGFVIAIATRLTIKKSITVAVETGVQNALLAVTVLTYSYPQPVADLAIRLPYLILIFTTVEGLSLALIYTLLKKFYWHGVPYDEDEEIEGVSDKDQENAPSPSSKIPTVSNDVVLVHKQDLSDGGYTTPSAVNKGFSPD